MSMIISHHGGQCCAIKHIHGLHDTPDETYPLRVTIQDREDYITRDKDGGNVESGKTVFTTNEITEPGSKTYGEVFDMYLEYLMRVRPYGMVEVTIVPTYNDIVRYDAEHCDDGDEEQRSGPVPVFDEEVHGFRNRFLDQGEESDVYISWVPFLEDRGFKLAAKVPNTNSGNLVHVYHLVMNGEYHKMMKKHKRFDCFNKKEK